MAHPALLDRRATTLVVIDLQESYRTVLEGWNRVVSATTLLVRGARLLGIPVVVTEQYPRGVGRTAAEVAVHLQPGPGVVEKMTMSCCGASAFMERLSACEARQVLVAGIEAHACVNQTVHDLLAAGFQVHVARDATSSRCGADVVPAWEKMCAAGMCPTSAEQALLELVRTAEAPEFKALQRLLKERPIGG
jgi:nicotinamidase-related amidase